ncbi:MAG: hypothetical protein ACFFED_17485 [Candidatus Thorarchaeota archaeon]
MIFQDRKTIAALLLVVVTISSLSIVVIGPVLDVKGFEWAVDEGLTLLVNITVSAYANYSMSIPELSYNRTTSWANVSFILNHLIPLSSYTSQEEFILEVVEAIKVSCSENDFPENYSLLLTRLLSYFIIPVGEWQWLDDIFNDEYNGSYYYSDETEIHYVTRFDADQFLFQKVEREPVFPNWYTNSWSGWINMSTGIPSFALFSSSKPDCTGSSSLIMNVTSIRTSQN